LVLGVVDGMGGHQGGARAAAIAATELAAADPVDLLARPSEAFQEVSALILRAGAAWGTPQMGCAVALLALGPDQAVSLNIGDCRAYRVGEPLERLSFDDRLPGPLTHVLTQCLGGTSRPADAHKRRVDHLDQPVTRYLICSDGLYDGLNPGQLRQTAGRAKTPAEAVQRLSALAGTRSQDNFSILVADVRPAGGGREAGQGQDA
jgi:serine/threonine protein phosphatase PrpC